MCIEFDVASSSSSVSILPTRFSYQVMLWQTIVFFLIMVIKCRILKLTVYPAYKGFLLGDVTTLTSDLENQNDFFLSSWSSSVPSCMILKFQVPSPFCLQGFLPCDATTLISDLALIMVIKCTNFCDSKILTSGLYPAFPFGFYHQPTKCGHADWRTMTQYIVHPIYHGCTKQLSIFNFLTTTTPIIFKFCMKHLQKRRIWII
jgi:hypothetical protein